MLSQSPLIKFDIDIRRLQLTNRRSDEGASAAAEGVGRVGAIEIPRNHEWCGQVAYLSTTRSIFGCEYGVTKVGIVADILSISTKRRTTENNI